jgi:hypothetical protein
VIVRFVILVEMLTISVEEEFEDTKGVIRIRISKKNRQHNDQKKKYKRPNNDLQNIYKHKLSFYNAKVVGFSFAFFQYRAY